MDSHVHFWQQVVKRAVYDSMELDLSISNQSDGTRGHIINQAKDFLSKPSKDLSILCERADIDMMCLIDRCKKLWNNKPDNIIKKSNVISININYNKEIRDHHKMIKFKKFTPKKNYIPDPDGMVDKFIESGGVIEKLPRNAVYYG